MAGREDIAGLRLAEPCRVHSEMLAQLSLNRKDVAELQVAVGKCETRWLRQHDDNLKRENWETTMSQQVTDLKFNIAKWVAASVVIGIVIGRIGGGVLDALMR